MDILKTLEEKSFWGHDFLTWLWFITETEGGEVDLGGEIGPVALYIDDMLVLESPQSQSKENILKTGDVSRSAEAAAALAVGKKVTRARFGMTKGEYQWSFTIDGASFDVTSMKIPTVLPDEDEDPIEGTVLVRLAYIRDCMDVVDGLFMRYAELRLSGEWNSTTVPEISEWIAAKEGD
ncbi:MAG: hypothetical protein C0609_05550 [Deltaproteobacteria bacterium]|nr:MAG: hypothetical protein C0609_05550 [Deltaproteobacteria bacterium]